MTLYLSMPWSRVNTEYSIQWVLHTLHTASCQHRLSPAPSQSVISWQTMLYPILYIPTIMSEPMDTVSAPIAPPSRTTALTLTASKYCSNLAWSWPQSVSLNSLDHSLQVYHQTRLITASECISKLTPWCRKTLELERRHPIINSLAHLACHLKGIREKERFWLK